MTLPLISRPYIGVTGFQHPEQIHAAVQVFQATGITSHILMCGMLAEPSLAEGGIPVSPRSVNSIDTLIALTSIAKRGAFPVVHYEISTCEHAFADSLIPLLRALSEHSLPLAVQLNGTPALKEVERIRAAFPDIRLAYQIRPELLKKGSEAVSQEIGNHKAGTFQYALIDPSCGVGKELDVEEALSVFTLLQEDLPTLLKGFAGGFDGQNASSRVARLRTLLGSDAFFIDAEGKLFTDTVLDNDKVAAYIAAAAEGFGA